MRKERSKKKKGVEGVLEGGSRELERGLPKSSVFSCLIYSTPGSLLSVCMIVILHDPVSWVACAE